MIAVSPIAFASHDSPPISFSIGDVAPGAHVQFQLKTVPGINAYENYSVTCDIKNPNYAKQYPIVMGMYTDDSATITLNGKPLNSGQAALIQPDNLYAAWPVDYITVLNFYNFDNSDTATVTNCVATPIVQTKSK